MNRSIRVGDSPGFGVGVGVGEEERFFLERLGWSEPHEPRRRMYGSSAAWCPRLNYLKASHALVGTENVFTASSELYMSVGDGLEAALASGLWRDGKLIFNNAELPPMVPDVGGKVDLVYVDDVDRLSIAEVKSCGVLPTKPRREHVAQLMTYVAVTGVDRAVLVYLSRNVRDDMGNVGIRCFRMDTGEDAVVPVLEKIAFSQWMIDNGKLPPVPHDFARTTTCAYCDFQSFCWEESGPHPHDEADADDLANARADSEDVAWELWVTRHKRYVKWLRHLFRNTNAKHLKGRIIKEIEKYDEF